MPRGRHDVRAAKSCAGGAVHTSSRILTYAEGVRSSDNPAERHVRPSTWDVPYASLADIPGGHFHEGKA